MNDTQNRTNNSRARRTPKDITHNGGGQVQRQGTQRANTGNGYAPRTDPVHTQRVQTGVSRQMPVGTRTTVATNGAGYRTGETRVRPVTSRPLPQRTMTGLTPAEEDRIVRRENRREKSEKKEQKWQKDIVRVSGRVDYVMLGIILILLALGTVAVFSSSYPLAIANESEKNYYIKNQLIFLAIGSAAMGGMALLPKLKFIPKKLYREWGPIFMYVLSVVLLIAVLFIGSKEGEAVRWIRFGSFGIQPSELMKVSIVLMIAWYAQKYEDRMKELDFGFVSYKWNTLIPLCILGFACGLVLVGKHLSGTIIVGGIGFLVLIVAGCKKLWLFLSTAAVGIPAVAIFLAANPYALRRITTFTDENADKLDELYQTTQSLYAIGNGGLTGVGLGESIQKHSYLAASHTDFIFSIWCEEWGFIGAVVLILLFVLFLWRGYVIAVRAPDKFTMLTAFGITTHIGLQAMLNMMVATSMIMNTGVSLPFFSYGGSSLIVTMFEMGILLAISRQSYRTKKDIEHDEMMRRAGMER